MKSAKNKQIDKLLSRLKPGKEFVYSPKSEAEFFGSNKPRYVDPWVLVNGKLERVSKIVPSLEYYFEEFSLNYKYIGVIQKP